MEDKILKIKDISEALEFRRKSINQLKIKNTKIHINSIGTIETRKNYSLALKEYLYKYKDELSDDSKIRLEKNPLRILDSKSSTDQEILINSPKIQEFYDLETENFLNKTLQYLSDYEVEYFVDSKLVRGLDYYTHTVFEIITNDLGAQGTIIAGGRYHNLSEFFGNKAIPCFGCAGGIERLMSLSEIDINAKRKIAILSLGENTIKYANKIIKELRNQGEICDLILGKNNDLKKLLTKANKQEYNFAIIIGENEILDNKIIIKDLDSGEQRLSTISQISDIFKLPTN